jgi:hypothetical protein
MSFRPVVDVEVVFDTIALSASERILTTVGARRATEGCGRQVIPSFVKKNEVGNTLTAEPVVAIGRKLHQSVDCFVADGTFFVVLSILFVFFILFIPSQSVHRSRVQSKSELIETLLAEAVAFVEIPFRRSLPAHNNIWALLGDTFLYTNPITAPHIGVSTPFQTLSIAFTDFVFIVSVTHVFFFGLEYFRSL